MITLSIFGQTSVVYNKLLFKIKQIEGDKTKVDIFIITIPKFIITLRNEDERLVDIDKLVDRLLK